MAEGPINIFTNGIFIMTYASEALRSVFLNYLIKERFISSHWF